MPKLVIHDVSREWLADLQEGEGVVIGRSASADLRIEAERASRRHAEIVPRGAGHVLCDLGSTNGTTLDGVPVAGETALRDGAEIRIGGCLLVYRSRP